MEKNKDPLPEKQERGITRRSFITTVGAGAVAMAGVGAIAAGAESVQTEVGREALLKAGGLTRISLHINGSPCSLLVEPRWTLLHVLREKLGLTGTKEGCSRGECGACTVLMNDIPHYACMILAVEAEGAKITTVEGLMEGEQLGDVQMAFAEEDAFQCGYCTPGQIMSVEGLLRRNPDPTPEEIRMAVSGNLCRCGAYANIFKAAGKAAAKNRH